MHREMRDISGDLRARADLLVGQMVAEQARFRITLTRLKEQEAIRRQRLETALQTVNRLINAVTMQHILHRALSSAVAALDAQAAISKGPLQKEKAESASPSLKEAAPEPVL
jgi:hypothetical protein